MDTLFSATDLNNLKLSCFAKISYPNGYVFDFHYHHRLEIMYILSGKLNMEIVHGTHKSREYLTQEQFIIFTKGTPHGFTVEGENTSFWTMEFEPSDTEINNPSIQYFSLKAFFQQCPILAAKIEKNGYAVYYDQCDIKNFIPKLLETYMLSSYSSAEDESVKYKEHDFLFHSYLQTLFILLNLNASMSHSGGTQYISQINMFLSKNYANDFLIEDLATMIGINRDYMERIYKRYTGRSIHRQLILLRLEKAKNMLKNSTSSITQIARETGFKIRQQLIYNFKNIYGVTPIEYRTRHSREGIELPPRTNTRSETYDFFVDP